MSTSFQSCPGCESFILADTIECPECGHVFDEERAKASKSLTRDLENQNMYDSCRKCGESVRSGLVRCWNCNSFMRKDVEARYAEMKATPQRIVFSDVPLDQRTEVVTRDMSEGRGDVYDAQDDDEFEFTLRSGDGQSPAVKDTGAPEADDDDGFELSPSKPTQPQAQPPVQSSPAQPPAAPPPAAPAAAQPESPAPTPTPAAEAPAAAQDTSKPEAEAPKDATAKPDAAETPATTSSETAKPEADEKKSVDQFDVNDLLGIAMQDQKETRKRKKQKVEEARSKRILLPCTRCGAWIRVHEDDGGRTLRCRQCKFPFLVPMMKKKEKPKKGAAKESAAKISIKWLDDVRFHAVAPTEIVLKPGSLEKAATAVDLGFYEGGLQVLTYAPPAKKSLFGKADGPPAVEEQRTQVRAHIVKTGAVASLPFGEVQSIAPEAVSKVRLVQPVAEAHESMFAGVPVFGAGRIALYLPLTLEDNKQAFVSLPISGYRTLAAELQSRFHLELNAQQNGVPMSEESETLKCKISEMPVTSVKDLEYYENDPDYELELSGYKCGTCGIAVGEAARAQQKLGGAAGKGIGKAKCPGCSNKMGVQKLYSISRSPASAEETEEEEEDVSSVLRKPAQTTATAPAAAAAPAKSELTSEALQGKWKMLTLGLGGNFDKPDDVSGAGIEFVVTGDKYSVSAGGTVQEQGILTFVATEKPAQLDLLVAEGPDAGKSHLGLVRIVDGKLHNCQAAFGEARPQSFESAAGSTNTLAIFERA